MLNSRTTRFALSLAMTLSVSAAAAYAMRSVHPATRHAAAASAKKAPAKPSIVLVHGTFADGGSWQHVIPVLERDGYYVIAVQNHLASLADDIATTKRVIDAQTGPIVVVGHSYGGAVITGAATGNSNVKALVYLAAFAPDSGESLGALQQKFPPSQLGPALVPDAAGFLYIDRAKFHEVFAADVPTVESRVLAATQKPANKTLLTDVMTTPAWKSIPTWYLVSMNDQTINPDLERFFAKRMGAHTTEIKASHVSYISHPQAVAKLIEVAADAVMGDGAQIPITKENR